ncbi:hypothetical protein N7461_005753 [Penicillium sp. DV-2018c]|nr:hypothetical protein N7461_005753 [Penicillium sp. DV-2018c]
MAHSHYRHSRIGRLINAKHRLQAEHQDENADSGLLKKEDPLQDATIPPYDILPDGPCDTSKDSLSCLQHDLNESDSLPQKREEMTMTSSEPVVVETVLKIVDASSHILFQSTATHFPMTISDSAYGTYTIPSSDSLTPTGAATEIASESESMDIPALVSPTLASTTDTPTPPAQTSFPTPGLSDPTPGSAVPTSELSVPTPDLSVPTSGSSVPTSELSVPTPDLSVPTPGPSAPTSESSVPTPELTTSPLSDTSSSNGSVASTQSSLTSANQVPSASRSATTALIHSPGWTSTPLVAPATSPPGSVTSPQAYFWSYAGPSSSINTTATLTSDASIYSTYETISSSVFTTTESTSIEPTSTESAGSALGSGSAPSASETQAAGSGTATNPDTPKIVGGVVGSVAGIALILLLLLYFLRRRGYLLGKHGRPTLLEETGAGDGARETAERRESNDPLFTASHFAPALIKRWRQSTATSRSGSTFDSAPSERGFQKIAGRKIPPVFTHGGDGYGGGLDGDSPTVPGFPPMSPPATGLVGSPTSHAAPPTSPFGSPLDSTYTREFEEHTPSTRPNPVHLPMSSAVNTGVPITVTPAQPIAQPQSTAPFVPPRPDGLGRSLHSYDGSRASRSSRFTESLDL